MLPPEAMLTHMSTSSIGSMSNIVNLIDSDSNVSEGETEKGPKSKNDDRKTLLNAWYEDKSRVSLTLMSSRKGPLWSNFSKVSLDGKTLDYVKCNHCATFLKYSGKIGTSSLNRHLRKCDEKGHIQEKISFKPKNIKEGPSYAKKQITRALVKFCANDFRPF